MKIRTLGMLFLSLFILSSCSLFKPKEQPQPELPPPPNYYPTFIKSPQPLVPNVDKELKLEISRFRIIDDESVELFFHLINKSYFFATGATAQAILHRWCGGEIITAETTIPISKLTIKEVVQTKREPYAIAFVLDHSGSMGDERAYEIQE
ncbi:MAG: hypothetical protein N2517_08185, partial [Ignavibacteria bacterium]|nr:hypothetical protein [Ignavibacteria bacterium]